MLVGDADFAAAVWEHSSSGVFAVDARGALVLMNAAGWRILGGPTPAARLGALCEDALAEHPILVRLLREALAGRAPLSRAEVTLRRPDGERLTLGFSLLVLPGESGGIRGAALVFRDLTPIERSDERQRLRERLVALGEMAVGLAHELRNPLAGMEVAAGLLQRRLAADPESHELVADLRGQLRRLSETVTGSLDFLRPVALRCEPIDPQQLVEEALACALARTTGTVRVRRRYAPDLPKLEADRQQLGVAVVNLVVNACEAMTGARGCEPCLELAIDVAAAPELTQAVRIGACGSSARSEASRPARSEAQPSEDRMGFPSGDRGGRDDPTAGAASRELRISVRDNGPGVPEEHRDRIFDPFFTTKASGSGIGLANVQKIATGHGGSISWETSSAGSVFRLHLPLQAVFRAQWAAGERRSDERGDAP